MTVGAILQTAVGERDRSFVGRDDMAAGGEGRFDVPNRRLTILDAECRRFDQDSQWSVGRCQPPNQIVGGPGRSNRLARGAAGHCRPQIDSARVGYRSMSGGRNPDQTDVKPMIAAQPLAALLEPKREPASNVAEADERQVSH